jgi:hypothetical protein
LQSCQGSLKQSVKVKKGIKKPPGVPAVSEVSGRFFQVRSELSTAAGVGEPKIAKEKSGGMHGFNVAQVIFGSVAQTSSQRHRP